MGKGGGLILWNGEGLILWNGEGGVDTFEWGGGEGDTIEWGGGGCYCGIRAYLLNLDSCVIGSVYL